MRRYRTSLARRASRDCWYQGTATLDEMAEALGVADTGARQRERHAQERDRFRKAKNAATETGTSFALAGDEEKAREAGAAAYLAKPYSPRELLQMI